MSINIIFLIVCLLGFWVSRREVIKKSNPSKLLRAFYKMGSWVTKKLLQKKEERFLSRLSEGLIQSQVQSHLTALNPSKNPRRLIESYYADKITLVLLCFFLCNVFSLLIGIRDATTSILVDEHILKRPRYGEGDSVKTLILSIGDLLKEKEVQISVSEQKYTKEEADVLLQDSMTKLEPLILGDNQSLDEIRSDLNLVDEIPGTICKVQWESSQYDVVATDGSLNTSDVSKDGVFVTLTATITCQDYEEEHNIEMHVYPPVLSEQELAEQEVLDAIVNADEQGESSDTLTLPESYENLDVTWKDSKTDTNRTIFLIGMVLVAAIYIGKDADLKKW